MDDGHRHVLTVDDERDVRLLCRVNLEPAGFRVLEAGNGLEALQVLERARIDVILLDVMMPVMDGWQLLATLKTDPALSTIPVVLFSAWLRSSDRRRGLDAGAAEFIEKPFSPRKLVETIRAVLVPPPCAGNGHRSTG